MPENIKAIYDSWNLKGFGIGSAVGFIFEVFFLRNSPGKFSWFVAFLSIIAMGLMGWLSYGIAINAFPGSAWKSVFWASGITAHTWWIMRMITSGQMFKLATMILLPENLRKVLNIKK